MMPMCSSRRSPRPFTAGIPPILGTGPRVSASWGRAGGRGLGCGGSQGVGGAGRTAGSCRGHVTGQSEEVPAPGDPSWHGAEQLSQPAHRVEAGGPRPPRCTHTRACTHVPAQGGTHPQNALTCARATRTHMRACAHTRTLGALLHTHAYTLAHTPHVCTHAPPSRASRALGCNLGSRSPHAAPDLHVPVQGAWRGHAAQPLSQRHRDPRPTRPRLCALHSMHGRAHLHAPPSPAGPCADPTNARLA